MNQRVWLEVLMAKYLKKEEGLTDLTNSEIAENISDALLTYDTVEKLIISLEEYLGYWSEEEKAEARYHAEVDTHVTNNPELVEQEES